MPSLVRKSAPNHVLLGVECHKIAGEKVRADPTALFQSGATRLCGDQKASALGAPPAASEG